MLRLSYQNLHEFPVADYSQVKCVDCCENQLSTLPEMPNVRFLRCIDNKFKSLPVMPKLYALYCSHNKIKSFQLCLI